MSMVSGEDAVREAFWTWDLFGMGTDRALVPEEYDAPVRDLIGRLPIAPGETTIRAWLNDFMSDNGLAADPVAAQALVERIQKDWTEPDPQP